MIEQLKKVLLKNNFFFNYAFKIETIQKDWIIASGDNKYLSLGYLKALEDSILSNVTFIYLVIYQNEKAVGVLYFQWIKIEDDFFDQKKFPNEIKSKITSSFLTKIKGSLLLCGNFFATGTHGFYFLEKIPKTIINTVISKLRFELCNASNTPRLNYVMVKEFWENQEKSIQTELRKKFTKFQIDVNMVLIMSLHWNNFDDYLNTMVTKYRTRAKGVYKKTKNIISVEFDTKLIMKHKTEIEALYTAVLETSSFNMAKLTSNSFLRLKEELKEFFIFKGYFYENKLVAFSTACINSSYLDANFVGINYLINNELPIYQRILYDYVDLAIQKKVNELRLGRTAETMKSSLGAVPKEMNLFVKHINPVLHTVLTPLIKYVKPSPCEIRNPFKKQIL